MVEGMTAKILVIDDSAFMRRIVKTVLAHHGYTEVVEAETGGEGVQKFAAETPDLVLLDIIMPDVDGIEVLEKIKDIDEKAKVVMLTAVGQEETISKCREAGALGYVTKPFEEKQVADTLNNILNPKEVGGGKSLERLAKLEEDALREVGYIGASHAAKALSKMIGETVCVDLLVATISPLTELPETVGDKETLVAGVYLPITGDVEGSVLMVFPRESALLLVDLLLKRERGTTKDLDEMDQSALKEVGNILAGNCLTALYGLLGMKLTEHVPDLAYGMLGAVIESVAVTLSQEAERTLVLVLELITETDMKIVGYFFLLFVPKDAELILKAIGKKVGA